MACWRHGPWRRQGVGERPLTRASRSCTRLPSGRRDHWYSGQYSADASEAAGRAFNERYPGVRCNGALHLAGGVPAAVRDCAGGAMRRAVLDHGGHYVQLKRQTGYAVSPVITTGCAHLRQADPDNFFQSSFLALPDGPQPSMVPEAGRRNLDRHLDPKWADKWRSGIRICGAIGVWAAERRCTATTICPFEANNRRSAALDRPGTMMDGGERPVGVRAFGLELFRPRRHPLKLIYPTRA